MGTTKSTEVVRKAISKILLRENAGWEGRGEDVAGLWPKQTPTGLQNQRISPFSFTKCKGQCCEHDIWGNCTQKPVRIAPHSSRKQKGRKGKRVQEWKQEQGQKGTTEIKITRFNTRATLPSLILLQMATDRSSNWLKFLPLHFVLCKRMQKK